MKSEVSAVADLTVSNPNTKRVAFSVEAIDRGSTVVFHCQGRLIFRYEAHALTRTVSEILPLARRMVVDLAGIESVDSAGLGELVLLHMWAESSGYVLKFSGATESVRKMLELTNLVQVLDLHSSVPEAIAAMGEEEACGAEV